MSTRTSRKSTSGATSPNTKSARGRSSSRKRIASPVKHIAEQVVASTSHAIDSAKAKVNQLQTSKSQQHSLIHSYLIFYNVVNCLAWTYVLSCIILHFTTADVDSSKSISTLYESIKWPLTVTQSLAFMEIIHSAVGFVRSPVMSVLMQVMSRLFLVFGICHVAPETVNHVGFVLMSLSWSIVEIPRYAFYAINLISPSNVPYWLTWLRYSLFAVLYPTGIAGELWCICKSIQTIRDKQLLSIDMPNAANIAIQYTFILYCIIILYIPGSPFMFSHMKAQRDKVLSKSNYKSKSS